MEKINILPELSEKYKKMLKKVKKILIPCKKLGLTITDISEKLKLNRNTVSKVLSIFYYRGELDMKIIGPAKTFFLNNGNKKF